MVDISALRKFADTFGPAIEAIPAVIDAVAQANDVDRHIAQKKAELDKIFAQIEEAKTQGEKIVSDAQGKAEEIRQAAQAQADAAKAAVEAEIAKMGIAIEGLQAEATKAQEDAATAIQKRQEAETAASAKMAELDAAHAARVKQIEADVKELEARKAKAEKALADLRAKLEA